MLLFLYLAPKQFWFLASSCLICQHFCCHTSQNLICLATIVCCQVNLAIMKLQVSLWRFMITVLDMQIRLGYIHHKSHSLWQLINCSKRSARHYLNIKGWLGNSTESDTYFFPLMHTLGRSEFWKPEYRWTGKASAPQTFVTPQFWSGFVFGFDSSTTKWFNFPTEEIETIN